MPNTLRERFDEKFWDWTLWFDEIVEFLEQEISLVRQEALKEWEERGKKEKEKIQNAYGVYVADTMDWIEPEVAYQHMIKTIDSL